MILTRSIITEDKDGALRSASRGDVPSDWLLAWYPDHGGWGMRLVVLAGTGQLSGGCVDVIGLGLRLSLSPSES